MRPVLLFWGPPGTDGGGRKLCCGGAYALGAGSFGVTGISDVTGIVAETGISRSAGVSGTGGCVTGIAGGNGISGICGCRTAIAGSVSIRVPQFVQNTEPFLISLLQLLHIICFSLFAAVRITFPT